VLEVWVLLAACTAKPRQRTVVFSSDQRTEPTTPISSSAAARTATATAVAVAIAIAVGW
jgi:hypothetical protein